MRMVEMLFPFKIANKLLELKVLTCVGIGNSPQHTFLMAAYRSSRDVGQMITIICNDELTTLRSNWTYASFLSSSFSTSTFGALTFIPIGAEFILIISMK